MTYKVGDILWVVGDTRPGLNVYRIVEEVTKKTLAGCIISYRVESPGPKDKVKNISLDSVSGTIFTDATAAKAKMLENVNLAISKMMVHSESLIKRYWIKIPLDELTKEELQKDDNYEYIKLENGQNARIKITSELGDLK